MKYFFLIVIPIIIAVLNFFFKKISLFSNYSGEVHQKFLGEKKVPLIGGIYLIFFSLFFFQNHLILCLFLFLIFLIGFSSDVGFITSPFIRLLLQLIVTIILVIFLDLQILSTRVVFLDHFLSYYFASILFTSFCLIILMNGSNFIDGLNGLVLGYYLIIIFILYKVGLINDLFYDGLELQFFIYFLSVLLLFNFSNRLYLGDAGSYLLSFLIGYLLISIYNNNLTFSPFFVVLLLWYPCYENLFSIIRKFKLNKSPVIPDNKHLHQLIFIFLKKKFKHKSYQTNNYASVIINLYNLIIFYFGSLDIYNTQYQIMLIILNVIIYTVIYSKFITYLFKTKI